MDKQSPHLAIRMLEVRVLEVQKVQRLAKWEWQQEEEELVHLERLEHSKRQGKSRLECQQSSRLVAQGRHQYIHQSFGRPLQN